MCASHLGVIQVGVGLGSQQRGRDGDALAIGGGSENCRAALRLCTRVRLKLFYRDNAAPPPSEVSAPATSNINNIPWQGYIPSLMGKAAQNSAAAADKL